VREVREYTPAEQAEILQRANNLLRRYGRHHEFKESSGKGQSFFNH
jgi:hypothetical protein